MRAHEGDCFALLAMTWVLMKGIASLVNSLAMTGRQKVRSQ